MLVQGVDFHRAFLARERRAVRVRRVLRQVERVAQVYRLGDESTAPASSVRARSELLDEFQLVLFLRRAKRGLRRGIGAGIASVHPRSEVGSVAIHKDYFFDSRSR